MALGIALDSRASADAEWRPRWQGEIYDLTGTDVVAGPPMTLGGAKALTAAPAPIPVRRYLLWAVLTIGVLVIAALALTLLRRVRES